MEASLNVFYHLTPEEYTLLCANNQKSPENEKKRSEAILNFVNEHRKIIREMLPHADKKMWDYYDKRIGDECARLAEKLK